MGLTPPPATGAWRPGDPLGDRQLFDLGRPLALDSGATLSGVVLAYETWGSLNSDASNAILINHAWTGDSHAAGSTSDPGWWQGLVGPGRAIDTDQFYVVCSNVLGGCQGSTGPASPHPDDGLPYGSRFPIVSIRDMVRAQLRLTDHLGIQRWHSVIGGSMGGMQSLEWAITYPDRVGRLAAIASCAQSSAQQIALGSVGRRAIRMDPAWRGGDYYDAAPGEGPWNGLTVARMIAQITFRNDNVFTDRFGCDMADGTTASDHWELWQRFEVERYLDYHGDKLVRRFDANSYLILGKAMELHDIGRGRNGLANALGRISMPSLFVGIWSDILYPAYQQRQLHEAMLAQGTPSRYVELDSPHGHDAFLIDLDQMGEALKPLLNC